MKEKLKEKLPYSLRQTIKKYGVKFWRTLFRTSDHALRIAAKSGLNLKNIFSTRGFADVFNSEPKFMPFGASDFLLLAERDSANLPETVETSIIIPVFNKVEFTFQCLRSLFREIDLTRNEIIIIDNASCDETPKILALLGNRIRVICNDENAGFVDACNQGARAARGEFLVFLNNDTIVQPDWLSSLVETIESDEQIGAVGSTLIYPNGLLQEAGAIVWRDGTSHAYGWGENPAEARFNFAREVDYCSGASLLIRKEMFDKLGGFDKRFAPAYYEDTDLCMSVRAAGFKVIFQPVSRLIHVEGATAGKNTSSGFKRFQEINRHKFVEKWREQLESGHFTESKKNISAASNRRRGKQILVFYDQIPKPDKNSAAVRMDAILKSLLPFSQIVFVPLHQKKKEDEYYARKLLKKGIEIVAAAEFEKELKNRKFDAVIICYPFVANYIFSKVKRMFPEAKIIFDTVDIHFVRLRREFEITGDQKFAKESKYFQKIETRIARQAEQVWCVTEQDSEFLKEVAPEAKIEIIPNIHSPHERGKSFAERRDLFFIGSFIHRPNADAVFYFIDKIFPLVLEKLPDVRFRIVGDKTPPEIFALHSEKVRVEGFVPDVSAIFQNSRIFVAPLLYGAGMKGKIGQALSYGLPTVTTSIGVEGMNLTAGREILIADSAEDFAAEILRLYQSAELWQNLSDNSFQFIGENFSPPIVEKKIRFALEKVLDGEKYLRQ
jgi:GT2 family glycosyltransferase